MWERKYIHTVSSNNVYRKLYAVRERMIDRCTNEKSKRYKDYGARGISVCEEWMQDFDLFVEWALSNGYQEGLTLDRIDNDGNYDPVNCRWITKREQNRNKRTNLMVEYKGEVKPLINWCEELNLKYDPIHNRITKGWNVEKAFTTPLASEKESFSEICRKHDINPSTAKDRIKKFGWSFEDAINTPVEGIGKHRKVTFGEATCPVCGNTFTKKVVMQKYCCEQCHKESKHAWYKKRIANY